MDPAITIREFDADEWRSYRALRLAALADSPDAFGSTLEREAPWPDADWISRLALGVRSKTELPLCAVAEDRLAALAWGRIDPSEPDVARLFQVWVSPGHRKRGVARRLVEAVTDWARTRRASELRLCVTRHHQEAVRLYTRAGFTPDGEPEPLRPGSPLLAQPMRLVLRAG